MFQGFRSLGDIKSKFNIVIMTSNEYYYRICMSTEGIISKATLELTSPIQPPLQEPVYTPVFFRGILMLRGVGTLPRPR